MLTGTVLAGKVEVSEPIVPTLVSNGTGTVGQVGDEIELPMMRVQKKVSADRIVN